MARIEKRVTDEQKQAWIAYCQDKGISESDMLGLLIEQVTKGKVGIHFKGLKKTKTNNINIRLSPGEIKKVTERAILEKFPSRTTWVKKLIISTLENGPVLTDTEVNTLRESNREINAIGRNLNQIAHALNIDFRQASCLNFSVIDIALKKIDSLSGVVNSVIDKANYRWSDE
jgi:hypothetical protein